MYTRSHENFTINVKYLIGRGPACGYLMNWDKRHRKGAKPINLD